MPTGPDIYFDNVGGRLGQTVMSLMRRPARVIECGQISTYNDDGGGWLVDVRPIHQLGLRLEDFNSMLFADFHPGAAAQGGIVKTRGLVGFRRPPIRRSHHRAASSPA
jgi:hypothetical protein